MDFLTQQPLGGVPIPTLNDSDTLLLQKRANAEDLLIRCQNWASTHLSPELQEERRQNALRIQRMQYVIQRVDALLDMRDRFLD